MAITLTENAAKQIRSQLAKRGKRVFHASEFNAAIALSTPPREGAPR